MFSVEYKGLFKGPGTLVGYLGAKISHFLALQSHIYYMNLVVLIAFVLEQTCLAM